MRMRKRVIAIAVWVAAMAGVILYMRCGNDSQAPAPAQKTARRCQLHIDIHGITVDGRAANRDTAVELCKQAGGADVTVEATAPHSDVLALQGALTAAHVDVLTHQAKQ